MEGLVNKSECAVPFLRGSNSEFNIGKCITNSNNLTPIQSLTIILILAAIGLEVGWIRLRFRYCTMEYSRTPVILIEGSN